jgi:hypothetical protein
MYWVSMNAQYDSWNKFLLKSESIFYYSLRADLTEFKIGIGSLRVFSSVWIPFKLDFYAQWIFHTNHPCQCAQYCIYSWLSNFQHLSYFSWISCRKVSLSCHLPSTLSKDL